jgi:hypothetical protein
MKKLAPFLILLVVILISGFLFFKLKDKSSDSDSIEAQESAGARLVINQLDQGKRPFVVLSQHPSGKLLAFYLQNTPNINGITVDLEYLSGDLLKGAKSTLKAPIEDPYAKAFLLGSCSAGGKCSFDKDLISGSLKLKLSVEGESDIHVLKGDYSFVDNETTTTDGRVTYTPSGKTSNEILLNTLGLPEKIEGDIELYPIAITTTEKQNIKGELEIRKKGISKAMIFNGSTFEELKAKISEDSVIITLNHAPREESVKIVRDDLKGVEEKDTFYVLGPVVLLGE